MTTRTKPSRTSVRRSNPKKGAGSPKGGPKPVEIDLETVEVAAGFGLTTGQIAALCGLSLSRFKERKAEDPLIQEAVDKGQARVAFDVSKALVNRAKDGDVQAIRWYEQTRLGRSEKSVLEHTGRDGGPLDVRLEVVDSDGPVAAT